MGWSKRGISMSPDFLYPRPEYPRPDMQRGTVEGYDWLNLNGPWQFRFDPERIGLAENWFEPDTLDWREQIIVPFCWESLAAWGEGDSAGNDNYYSTRVFVNPLEVTRLNHRSAPRFEVGWYRRTIEIPDNPAWEGKRVILTIGAADFYTDCWCNGKHLGHHEGGYIPFEFDLTDVLVTHEGRRRGLIVLRVEDPMDNSQQPVGKQWRWYTTTSGIWQTVYVEPRAATNIRSFRFTSDIQAGSVLVQVRAEGADDGCVLDAEIELGDAAPLKLSMPVQSGRVEQNIQIPNPVLWDPNHPHLYPVLLALRRGSRVLDVVRTYFGLRKIDFELSKEGSPAALRLNGVARYLRGALYQSYYPDGVYTAASSETLRNDIRYAKQFGFNFLRIHIKLDDPMLLYWADKLGILLMADFPNFGEGGDTPLGRQRFETMMRQGVDRDYNHPSIFAWCLFNETWGFGGQTGFIEKLLAPPKAAGATEAALEEKAKTKLPAQGARPGMSPPQVWVQQMWELAKKLDSTRLVEDMSVCHWDHLEYYLHCDTDINSWHFYISDYQKGKEHIEKIVRSTFVGSSFNYVPGFLHKGQPLINSEYGGVGALDGDRDTSWSFKFLTNELRRHQQIAAYIYTELHDVEWEYNGFLNYDRTPKEFGYDPRIINESNTLPVDSPPVCRVAPRQRVLLDIASSHYSTRRYDKVWLHWALAGVDSRGRYHQDLQAGRVRIPFPHRQVAAAKTLELEMPGETMLCTLWLSARTGEGVEIAQNFLHYFVTPGYPPSREDLGRTLILRAMPFDWVDASWSGYSSDHDKCRAEDCCGGSGHGHVEWLLPLDGVDISRARRVKVLCEASSRRSDVPQTDDDIFSSTISITLNDVPMYQAILRDHPHDSRGVLSYWRGGLGAYGYLAHAAAEGEMLKVLVANTGTGPLRLRCSVPESAGAKGGLLVYGAECGRYPLGPTVIIDW
jgi:hypothetical protein